MFDHRVSPNNQFAIKYLNGPFAIFVTKAETRASIIHKKTKVELRSWYVKWLKLPDEHKQKYSDIYLQQFNYPDPWDFELAVLDLRRTKPKYIFKNAYLQWLRWYLAEKVPAEKLETDSVKLAIEMGETWNKLSKKEKAKWAYINAMTHRGTSISQRSRSSDKIPYGIKLISKNSRLV